VPGRRVSEQQARRTPRKRSGAAGASGDGSEVLDRLADQLGLRIRYSGNGKVALERPDGAKVKTWR